MNTQNIKTCLETTTGDFKGSKEKCKNYVKSDKIPSKTCGTCDRYRLCYLDSAVDNYEAKNEEKDELEIWSAGGIALRRPKEEVDCWIIDSYIVKETSWEDTEYFNHLLEFGHIFLTQERAELEIDRRQVEYIMKKMACESNKIADWRATHNHCYVIKYSFQKETKITKRGFRVVEKFMISFNEVYFNAPLDAEKCLDYLKKTYGEERMKEIWGIR